jgi:hypothetical protein
MSYSTIKSRTNYLGGNVASTSENPPEFKGYQTFESIDRNNFTGDLVAVLGGSSTITKKTTGQPYEVSEATEVYNPENTALVPLTSNADKSYWECNSTAAAGSIAITLPNIAISVDSTFGPVIRVSDNTKTLNVVLTSTTSSDTITFSNVSTTGFTNNVWGRLCLEMALGTVAGTIDYNKFTELEVISNGATQVFAIFDTPSANNINCFLGTPIIQPFIGTTDMKAKLEQKLEEIKAGISTIGVGVSEKSFEVELEIPYDSLSAEALTSGGTVKKEKMLVLRTLNGEGEAQQNAVSAGTFTVTGVVGTVANLRVYTPEGVPLTQSNTLQTGNTTTYLATLTTGTATITVDTSYNAQKLIVKEERLETMETYTNDGYNPSVFGIITWGQAIGGGKLIPTYFLKTKVVKYEKKQDKVNTPITITFGIYAKKVGKKDVFYKKGITNA